MGNENATYSKIFNHMRGLRTKWEEEGKPLDDDAMYYEQTAQDLGIDFDEHEDLLMDTATEVANGCF